MGADDVKLICFYVLRSTSVSAQDKKHKINRFSETYVLYPSELVGGWGELVKGVTYSIIPKFKSSFPRPFV